MAVKIDRGQAAGLINMTPMIDVVFQLLLFFLVASRFADEERQLKVMLPQASEAKSLLAKVDLFTVNVDRQGDYFVDGRSVSPGQLEGRLRQLATNNPGRQSVEIRADRRCQWEHVVLVMNLCNKVRIRDYRVATTADRGA